MTAVTGTPYSITSATVTLGSDTFENMIGKADCVPSYGNSRYPTIDGDSHPIADKADWMLELDIAQDWETATSLTNYLAAHDGEIVSFEYLPASGAGKKVTGNVLIRATNVGGQARQTATSSVSLPIKGTPTLAAVA